MRPTSKFREEAEEAGGSCSHYFLAWSLWFQEEQPEHKVLAKDLGRDVYALDLRNHGESAHNPRHDYLAMADDIVAWMDTDNIKSATIIGHSMGAKTAMVLALQWPDLVKDIVAVDNAPIDAALLSNFGKYIQGMKRIEVANVKSQRQADEILQEYEKDLSVRQFLLGNLYRPEGGTTMKFRIPLDYLGNALDNLGSFPFTDPDAVRFEKPALFVRGTKSHYVPDEALPIIGRFFPRFELADIDAGHWVIAEQPEAFRKAVVEFLSLKE